MKFVISEVLMAVGVLVLAPPAASGQAASIPFDQPINCELCAEWNRAQQPFRIFGNTYYVGVAGLSVILIKTDEGLILLDAALPQSVPLISENIAALGFRLEDVRLIVSSHTHYDHVGGIAALQRLTGASVAASPSSASALEGGTPTPDDPQYGFHDDGFARVSNVRRIADGEVLQIGEVRLIPHFTPGHTPGSTTWTWQSCEDKRCLNVVYADSLNPVSAPGFKFSGDASTRSGIRAFEKSIAEIESLPCDVLLSPHPTLFDMAGKLGKQRAQPSANPFIDSGACRRYAEQARVRLRERIEQESTTSR